MMNSSSNPDPARLFEALGNGLPKSGTRVLTRPADGAELLGLSDDTAASFDEKRRAARTAQSSWAALPRRERVSLLESFATAIKQHRDTLAQIIWLESGKVTKEGLIEADGAADTILKTIKDASLSELNGMLRTKERLPLGVIGLITSFNFPLAVASWTFAPALLAGNAVLWKPSEKTPLTALALKAIFDQVFGPHKDLLQILIGGRAIGEALVAHEEIDMISATGSVAMGQGIKAALSKKANNSARPILELGGNNGAIISDKISPEHLEYSLKSLMHSFLGTTGQRCTNTRRLIVQRSLYDKACAILEKLISDFLSADPLAGNDFGYASLIDADAYQRFERAKQTAVKEGGTVLFGRRLREKEFANAYYIEPALIKMPEQTEVMHEETFAPLLYIVPYDTLDDALRILNAPGNAGLTNAIYTQSQKEADQFALRNQAGHSVINSPKGTGTPAYGMGFGGNKQSGEGEILNAADPLRPFVREDSFHRIAQNKEIVMDK